MNEHLMKARRALMYVPGNDERKITKAAGLDVDGIILDLEDGVASNRKDEARETILRSLREVDFGRSERLVRINSLASGRGAEDLRVVLPGVPDMILVPKVDVPEDVREVENLIAEVEAQQGIPAGHVEIALTIESALAFIYLASICQSSPRLQVLVFGAEDFTADTGITRTAGAGELLYARSSLVMHAAAFGLQAIDMVMTNYTDTQLLEQECQAGAELGFAGKQIIHPSQVGTVQRVFTPGEKEIQYALRILEGAREAQSQGRGAFALDGRMIDMPVIKRAEGILARARMAGILN